MKTRVRPIILTFVQYYLPGSKGGGPIRSIANMVERLSDEFEFRIVSLDRDLGDKEPYASIKPNVWVEVGNAKVFYIRPGLRVFFDVVRAIRSSNFNLLYVNSFFSRPFSMYVVWIWRVKFRGKKELLIAPRGEFGLGALNIKPLRKRLYLTIAEVLGVYDHVSWHASSNFEMTDIGAMGLQYKYTTYAPPLPSRKVTVAPDLPGSHGVLSDREILRNKISGQLRVVFIARIVPIKNLDYAINVLKGVQGDVDFSIYGPQEDKAYWAKCAQMARDLPANIRMSYLGVLDNSLVDQVLRQQHLYFLPSKGENFGHGILEAMSCGCPVLISDCTYWRNLATTSAGWDISLDDFAAFVRQVQRVVDMNDSEFQRASRAARNYSEKVVASEDIVEANRSMFRTLING